MKTLNTLTAVITCVVIHVYAYSQTNYFAGTNSGSNNTGVFCTGVGIESLANGNHGDYNTGFGYASLLRNGIGYGNSAVGYRSLNFNIDGYFNTALGYQSMYSNQNGYGNVANGANALYYNTSGAYNVAVGQEALYRNSTGIGNTGTGYHTLYANSLGNYNTASGYNALALNSLGNYNVATGYRSLYNNVNGSSNTAIGYNTLYTQNGSYNTAVGRNAGYARISNNNCTYLGYAADASVNALTNATAIGNAAKVNASNKVVIGNTSVTVIGGQVGWSTFSDGRFKTDIKQNVPGLSFINRLNPVTYHINYRKLDEFLMNDDSSDFKDHLTQNKKLKTGFIAQEVEKIANDINYDFDGINKPQNDKDNFSIVYAAFVPSLVKAVQELAKQNDELKREVEALRQAITNTATAGNSSVQIINISSGSLEQNLPNPFNSSTKINYTLPQTYASAKIIITDKSGKVLKEVNINGSGKGNITVDASSLTAGTYQYTLYANGKLIDTKQMVIIK